jgi:dipeptidyl aminopeptidase/acylaminoacyl peptidase
MVTTQDIRAGVIWAGVVAPYLDMFAWFRTRPPTNPQPPARRWREELIAQYGSPEQNPAFWASISANSYLEDLSGPIQLHHGTADETVPLGFSANLAEQIRAVGGTVEYYTYEGANHNLTQGFALAMERSVQFFDTYVKGQ